jgi:uncharacterized tellurite resistance protein B-like protein
MSFSDLYSSGAHKRNIGHFSDIVKLALSDGLIDEREEKLLTKLAKVLDITSEEFSDIVKNPENYPTRSATSLEERIEVLYYLTRMLLIDGQVSEVSNNLLKKIAIGLGFKDSKVDVIVDAAIKLFLKIPDIEEFSIVVKKAGI